MIQLFHNARRIALSMTQRRSPARCLTMHLLAGVLFTGIFLSGGAVAAQTRDHLTDPETDLIRFYQELDKRMDVFIKAIDRRFAIINGTASPPPGSHRKKGERKMSRTGATYPKARTRNCSETLREFSTKQLPISMTSVTAMPGIR